MKRSIYNLIIGLVLLYGFVMNVIIVQTMMPFVPQINIGALCVGYLIVGIIGIFMVTGSDSAFTAFIGYNLICLPSGLLLAVILKDQTMFSVMSALYGTVAITVIMMLLATIFPSLFEGLGVSLSISLTVGIIVSFFVNSSRLDWIFVILFALYIGYDWTIAQKDEPKLSNAIMHAANLYLDIVNLFTRMLDDN